MSLLLSTPKITVYLSLAISLLMVVCMCKYADWRAWKSRSERQHLWYACLLFLSVFWGMGVRIEDAVLFHPMLVTTLVFVFGFKLSGVLAFLAMMGNGLLFSLPLSNVGCNFLVAFMAPAVCARTVLYFIAALNIKNLFIYLLGGGFFGGILSTLSMNAALWVLSIGLPDPAQSAIWGHWEIPLLMLFPEGFGNGVIITTLTVLAPNLVKTYDDHFYLDKE